MITDNPNTLTCQYAGTNDSLRDLLHGPVSWNTNSSRSNGLCLRLLLRLHLWNRNTRQHYYRHNNAAASRSCPLPAWVIWHKIYNPHQKFSASQCLWLHSTHHNRLDLTHQLRPDSTHCFLLDFTHHLRLDPPHCFQLYSTHGFQLDLTQFFYLIWLTFTVFIFDLSKTIWVPPQLGFRESQILQGVLEIIQHRNLGIFHSHENSNYFWQKQSIFSEKIR